MKRETLVKFGFLLVVLVLSTSAFCLSVKDFKHYTVWKYEEFKEMKDIKEFEGEKIQMAMTYTSHLDCQDVISPASSIAEEKKVSLPYCPLWIKEAWPRESNLIIIEATIPIVINHKKELVDKVKLLDKDVNITVYGVIRKKKLSYQIKRTLYYLDVEFIKTNTPTAEKDNIPD